MKRAMKLAARMTRDAISSIAASELLSDEPETLAEARALTLRSVARAVWCQGVKLARLPHADTTAGASHLVVHDNQ
eukprot:9482692-Pyramimonas_sp.AAC.1